MYTYPSAKMFCKALCKSHLYADDTEIYEAIGIMNVTSL